MEEDVFPHVRSREDPNGMEEERRLCYVGITRAKERLHLSHARRRMTFGQTKTQRASRFLREIPPECYHDLSRPYESPSSKYADVDDTDFVSGGRVFGSGRPQPGRVPAPVRTSTEGPAVKEARERLAEQLRSKEPAQFRPGDRVRHLHFGDGIVTKSTGGGPDEQVTVVFPGHGEKKLMVSYAKLEKL